MKSKAEVVKLLVRGQPSRLILIPPLRNPKRLGKFTGKIQIQNQFQFQMQPYLSGMSPLVATSRKASASAMCKT